MNRVSLRKRAHGFSTVELLIVIAVALIVAGMAVPQYLTITRNLRISGDNRDLNGSIAQAKMRAAADFTQARVYVNLADNTFRIQTWSKTTATTGCWRPEGVNAAPCSTAANPGAGNALSAGVTFGFGQVGTPPANTQPAIGQAASCRNDTVLPLGSGGAIPNTACIVFNSRGIPIDAARAPTNTGAFYITNAVGVYGVTVGAAGQIQSWVTSAKTTSWHPN